jgi:hypothetical protein
MSLLSQFGVEILQKKTRRGLFAPGVYFTASIGPTGTYNLNIGPMIAEEKLEWDAVDVAFSKQLGGLLIAKGTTFKAAKNNRERINSIDIFKLIIKSFSLKQPKKSIRVLFDYEFYSQDVYILKLNKIDYNE